MASASRGVCHFSYGLEFSSVSSSSIHLLSRSPKQQPYTHPVIGSAQLENVPKVILNPNPNAEA